MYEATRYGLCARAAIWCNSRGSRDRRHKRENHFPCAKKYSISKSRSFYGANMTFMSWDTKFTYACPCSILMCNIYVQVSNGMEVSGEHFHDISCHISSLRSSIWFVVFERGANVTVTAKVNVIRSKPDGPPKICSTGTYTSQLMIRTNDTLYSLRLV